MIRRWMARPRFSLWAMLVVVTVVAIPLSYVAQRRAWNLRRAAFFKREGNLESTFSVMSSSGLHSSASIGDAFDRWLIGNSLHGEASQRLERVWTGFVNFGSFVGAEEADDFDPLNLSCTDHSVTDADLAALADFPELEDVEILHADLLTDRGLAVVARLPNLRRLSLAHSKKVTGAFLRSLPRSANLEELSLQRMPALRGEALENLHRCPQLRSLTLGEEICLSNESSAQVNLPASLETLTIRKAEVGGATLVRWLGQCKLISLELNTSVNRRTAEGLGEQTKLREFTLVNAPLQDEDLQFLSAMPSLESCSVMGATVNGSFLKQLGAAKKLHTIRLSNTLLNDSNAEFLLDHSKLANCDLSFTPITGRFLTKAASWEPPRHFSLIGVEFCDDGKAALSKLSGAKTVQLPMNWTERDFELFSKQADLPYECEVGDQGLASVMRPKLEKVSWWAPAESLVRIDRCPQEAMAPVIRLRKCARMLNHSDEEYFRQVIEKDIEPSIRQVQPVRP